MSQCPTQAIKQNENLPLASSELPPYLTLFNRHLGQLREHLTGTTQGNVHTPSFINSVYWKAPEKDAFFHALAVYSRLRPDLIAACIGTKNEVEVLQYIALLEEGLQALCLEEGQCRRNLPLAHETSDAWVAWEEENAERLQANEEIWSEDSVADMMRVLRGTSEEMRMQTNDLDRDLPLGGIPSLTYGHLVVLDLLLDTCTSKDDGDAASSTGDGTPSAQAVPEVGSIPPIWTLQPSASQSLDGSLLSLGKSASPTSQPDLDPPGEDQSNIRGLSPRSRRRYQKRMYMRRKRAQATGGEADYTTAKLPSGRRKPEAQTLRNSSTTNTSTGGRDMESERTVDTTLSGVRDPVDNGDQISESGDIQEDGDLPFTTLGARHPYKTIRSDFRHLCVNKESISSAGLDLFNYKKLGKLSRHFVCGYDPNLISEDVSLSTETLVLLSEILKDFLVQTISRVVSFEEEHQRLRGKSKVWRRNLLEMQTEKGLIDKSAIQFTLKTMGQTNESAGRYFADLLGEDHDLPSHQQTGYDDIERIIVSQNDFHQHPLHQDICPPLYHFIPACDHSRSWNVDEEINDLMDVDTDEEKLRDVLDEEELLDEEDTTADTVHEESLWTEVPFPKKRTRSH